MTISVKTLGLVDYQSTYQRMIDAVTARARHEARDSLPDELWLLQHPPVFTLGKAGKRSHILNAGNIPVVETDRGGQVTYHGPGQLVVYALLDLKRYGLGPRGLVKRLEEAVINALEDYSLDAQRQTGAPGVYLAGRKIASLGLRIKSGISYHGLAVNVDMDLQPFSRINPCGYAGLEVTQLSDHVGVAVPEFATVLINRLQEQFELLTERRLAS